MSLSQWAAGVIRKRARRTVILRRVNSSGLGTVLLAANLAAGAAVTSFKSQAAGRLSGTAVKGSKFTVTGVTGTYTLTSDATVNAAGVVAVTFSPAIPLGQSALTGAGVTFTQKHSENVIYPVLHRQVSDLDQKGIEGGEAVKLLPFDALKPTPRLNDLLDGVPIVRLQEIDGDDGVAYYRCHVNQKVAT